MSRNFHTAALVLSLCALSVILTGCSGSEMCGGAGADFDVRVLDRIPVLPVSTAAGHGSSLVRSDGTLLTCSHLIPRGAIKGEARVAGRDVSYHVQASGDELATSWGEYWSISSPPIPTTDWAVVSTLPTSDVYSIFVDPLQPVASSRGPVIGESLYIVGYVVVGTAYVREWVGVEVIHRPSRVSVQSGDLVYWLRTRASKIVCPSGSQATDVVQGNGRNGQIERGLSGGPVLRRLSDGSFEVCAILIASEFDSVHQPTGTGVAIGLSETVLGSSKK